MAPLPGDGHVNLSPEGIDALAVIDPRRVAYLDLTGSGAETIAHLRENGRIALMPNAFTGPPRIVRLYGEGRVHLPGSNRYSSLAVQFAELPGVRSIIEVEVGRVQTSCGLGVPEELVGSENQAHRVGGRTAVSRRLPRPPERSLVRRAARARPELIAGLPTGAHSGYPGRPRSNQSSNAV
jgi:hypothetical protein